MKYIWLAIYFPVLIWSAVSPKDPFIWFLEVLPALIGLIILTLGAFYELIEWWVALASGEDAVVFLATQSYIWDTQSDMMYALIGGVLHY